jgi:hypothetical protein
MIWLLRVLLCVRVLLAPASLLGSQQARKVLRCKRARTCQCLRCKVSLCLALLVGQ